MNQTDNADYSPKEVATFVWFEYTMFDQAAKAILSLLKVSRADSQGGVQDPKQLQRNVLLASFLIHARNLRAFLFPPPPPAPRPDDVLARHFLPEWDEKVEELCPYFDANRDRLNKSLAHISYKRIEYEPNKKWEYVKIHTELTAAWDKFFSSLPEEKQKWFTRPRERAVGVTRL